MSADSYSFLIITYLSGLAINLVRYFELHNRLRPDRPPIDNIYWAQFFIMPLVSVLIAYVWISDCELNAFSAITIGVTGPLILKQIASAIPHAPP